MLTFDTVKTLVDAFSNDPHMLNYVSFEGLGLGSEKFDFSLITYHLTLSTTSHILLMKVILVIVA